ncbi:TetR/AcrR family transcriptional regulator [Streptomyces sp. NPDC002172]
MAEASASGLAQTAARAEGLDPAEVVERYVSREHRDGRGDGCTIAALSGDAARQPADIRTEFAAGIENLLTALQAQGDTPGDADQRATRTMVIDMLAHSVGAVMLSRACPDGSPLADEILDVCRAGILASLTHGDVDGAEAGARKPDRSRVVLPRCAARIAATYPLFRRRGRRRRSACS